MKHPCRIPGEWWRPLGLLFLLLPALAAAEVRVSVDRNPVPLDESFRITFTVEGEAGEPDFSVLEKDFQVLGTSRSLRTTFVNGAMQRQQTWLVTVMARRAGRITVPAVSFGAVRSPPLEVEVTEPASGGPQAGDVFMEVSVDTERPYVQQQVILTVRIFRRIEWREGVLSTPRFRGGEVLVEQLGEDRHYQALRDGRSWRVIERRYVLFPQASGRLEMEPLVLDLRIPGKERPAGRRSPFGDPFFDDFFGARELVRKVVRSRALELEVRPVPAAFGDGHWLPARSVKLEEQWSVPPDRLRAGEPVTRTLVLTVEGASAGQLPELEPPSVPGLRIYADRPETRETVGAHGVRATAVWKFAIIPSRAGRFELPPLEVPWWDLQKDARAVARLPARTLEVAPAPAAAPAAGVFGPAAAPAEASALPGGPPSPSPTGEGRDPRLVWLAAGNLVLLLLWLATLAAWRRERRRRNGEGKGSAPAGEERAPAPDWSALHRAAESGDPRRLARAALAVGRALWPRTPPRSLEALAARMDEATAEQLQRLSRHLYGGGAADWDGAAIEAGLRARAGRRRKERASRPALRPLYPEPEEASGTAPAPRPAAGR